MRKTKIFCLSLFITTTIIFSAIIVLLGKPKVALEQSQPQSISIPINKSTERQTDLLVSSQETSSIRQQLVNTDKNKPLSLELMGVVFTNVKDPLAFIKDLETGKQGIYRCGSYVGEARITKIAKGYVVLERDKTEEILKISASKKTGNFSSTSDIDPVVVMGENEFLVNKKHFYDKQQQLLSTIKRLKFEPVKQQDGINGIKVQGVSEESIISQAGICDNDIITMVNYQSIDSYQKALQILQKIKNSNEVKVHLVRGSEQKMLTYRIQ
ncbi:MAG: PDZ domain-containing protein [Candidatus Omnitrophica bacterium]|nr:PDZ domain-containing protein [Candidatus Omnitrophota bacterium]